MTKYYLGCWQCSFCLSWFPTALHLTDHERMYHLAGHKLITTEQAKQETLQIFQDLVTELNPTEPKEQP